LADQPPAGGSGPALALLLPSRDRLRGRIGDAPRLARLLARADRLPVAEPGRDAQLLRQVDLLPRRLAPAAITRALDADDAGFGSWLRADPAHVRADLTRGRMLAVGADLELEADEVEALLKPLKPLFGDEGFPISAPVPSRWYLALPAEVQLPPMSHPDDALGDDLHEHLPPGDAGRRWRRLLNEAQVTLHNHPLNAERIAAGKLAVNSLWFWGGGALPDQVRLPAALYSDDPLLQGMARLAGSTQAPLRQLVDAAPAGAALVDLRSLRDIAQLEAPWLPWALQQLAERRIDALQFDFADGGGFVYRPAHRWRVWRRALAA
jgi:hypothetical protein